MKYRISHRTEYIYHEPVSLCHNEARLLPRELPFQSCLQCELAIEPQPSDRRERFDYFGNRTMFFAIEQPHERLIVSAESHIQLAREPWDLEAFGSVTWESVREILQHPDTPDALAARQFVYDSPLAMVSPELHAYAGRSFLPGRPMLSATEDLMHRIFREFEFVPDFTTTSTPLSDVLEHRRGVCQDFAQLAIGCLRSLGLAARYVSGYIETAPPPGKERLQGADASHAWFAAWIPGLGWVDFDPTNDQMPYDQHITIGWGRDFSDVTPLKGVIFSSGRHKLNVGVDMERLEA